MAIFGGHMFQVIRRKQWWQIILLQCLWLTQSSYAQVCPENIDFENGNFNRWIPYVGQVSAANGIHQFLLTQSPGAEIDRHTMFNRVNHSAQRDIYGGFPVVCPNGSGFSVKLGNSSGGGLAEGLAYEFTIPADRNQYSITYHYAVVFEGPNHREYEQPRLEIEVLNVSDQQVIDCSSFKFVPFGSALPGFYESPNSNGGTPVWCKDWTAVTINLNNQAGKTIRLFFKTGDCTFVRHFGYAYIDVNTECTGEFTGARYCAGDTSVTMLAPYGFQEYKWFDQSFTRQLGSRQELYLQPPPPPGTILALEVTPYNGYGCKDTLYARLVDTLTVTANAGGNQVYCGVTPVVLGENPKPGIRYRWSPATGLSDPAIANPFATPSQTTRYVLTVTSGGGGCVDTDTILVTSSIPDTTLQTKGQLSFCRTTGDSAVLLVTDTQQVQWYRGAELLPGEIKPVFRAVQSGDYRAVVTNTLGCSLTTRSVPVLIEDPVPAIRYPLLYAFVNQPLLLEARKIGVETKWNPSVFLSNASTAQPEFLSRSERIQEYKILLTSKAGCITVDTQTVQTIKGVSVFLPNAFTPNNDRLNDVLAPILTGVREITVFKVFNRWGLEVYSYTPFSEGWDGTYKGVPQRSDTYTWRFTGIGFDNKVYEQKGLVVLMR